MSSYSRFSGGGVVDMEEGRALVARRTAANGNKSSAFKTATRPLRATLSSPASSWSVPSAISSAASQGLPAFVGGMFIVGSLLSLFLVLYLLVGKAIHDNGVELAEVQKIYRIIQQPPDYCLTPNNADHTYILPYIT